MEILQVAASKLKCKFAETISGEYVYKNYGIKSCGKHIFKPFDNIKLELIFISNIEYVCLNQNQLMKIKAGNYKNLFVRKAYSGKIKDIDLNDPVIINNITIVNNVASDHNDEWLTTEF